MAPILIDGRDQLKLGLVSILITILVFTGGFFIGHQRAAAFYRAGSGVQSLSLPEKTTLAESALDSQVPEVIAAGEDIDVDQPDTNMSADSAAKTPAPELLEPVIPMMTSSEDKKLSAPKRDDNKSNNSPDNSQMSISQNTHKVKGLTSNALEKIKYSIQVGMYGRLINAENMVNRLQSQQYDAYVSDYTNQKNEIRYNVRFGYFADKKSAVKMLGKFKANEKADGYLVKFSVDNIVHLADVAVVKQVIGVPVHKNKTGEVSQPVKVSSDIAEDKVSQADVLNSRFITAN